MNNENLKPPESTSEARARGMLGGIASGKSKRRKQAIRELISELLPMPVTDTKTVDKFSKFFPELDKDSLNYINLAFMRVLQDMTSSDTRPLDRIKIIEFLRDTLGEKPIENIKIDDARAEELHIDKVLSERFTDDELVEMVRNMYMTEQTGGN